MGWSEFSVRYSESAVGEAEVWSQTLLKYMARSRRSRFKKGVISEPRIRASMTHCCMASTWSTMRFLRRATPKNSSDVEALADSRYALRARIFSGDGGSPAFIDVRTMRARSRAWLP